MEALKLRASRAVTSFSIGIPFFIGAILMLIVFAIQHRGILRTAKTQN